MEGFWLLQLMWDLTQNALNGELTPPVKYWEACLGTTPPTVSPCWKVKIIWSPTSETSAAVIYSLYFILYFIQPIIYLGPGAREPGFALRILSSRLQPSSAACPPPTTQLKPFVGPVGRGSLPMILRCCWKFNPHTVRNEVLLLSLLLLQLWSSPNVIRQWPWHDWHRNW